MTKQIITKNDLVGQIHEKTDFSRKDIKAITDLFVSEMKDALVKRAKVELRGFGSFEAKVRAGRKTARNPRTGEIVETHAHGAVTFKSGQDLKRAVWTLPKGTKVPGKR
jgi:integration host factor subunit beta